MSSLQGKRAWITGAGTGIGAASAEALAIAGAEVILSGRRAGPLDEVAATIRTGGGQAQVQPLDVADSAAAEAAAEAIGPVDILVASAGLNTPERTVARMGAATWDKVVGVNLNGMFYSVNAALPGMRSRGGGQIIMVSSWAGRYPTRLTGAAYSAAKRAVISLGESINEEEGGNNIRSTVIMPGEVATPILKSRPVPPSDKDMARMLQIEDMARLVRFVAETPAHVCLNEILISPTWNRFYRGFDEVT